MSKINFSIAFIAVLILQSCSAQMNNAQTTTVKVDTTKSVSIVKPDSVTVVVATTEVVNPIAEVYESYIGLKNSLTKDNGDSAAAYSKKLYKSISDVKAEKLTAAQKTVWTKYMDKLSYDAEHIKETNDLEHQREHFTSLSKNMYELVKEFNTNSEDVYYQFCPMANAGKGAYWISENPKISNPYFGKQMLSCGSTKETIAPVK